MNSSDLSLEMHAKKKKKNAIHSKRNMDPNGYIVY